MSSVSPTYLMRVALRCTQMHSDTLRRTQMHSDALRCTQMHSDALRYTQAHSDALRCTQAHSDALRYTQIHSGALRCTQMHSGAIRCIRRYLPAQAEQQSKPIQVAVVSKQDGALGRAQHDAPLKCTEQPVQQRRILRGRALIHVLNRTQVVLPPNPLVQLRQSVTISRNQSQSVAISGSSVVFTCHPMSW